jgi:hypothetical protein
MVGDEENPNAILKNHTTTLRFVASRKASQTTGYIKGKDCNRRYFKIKIDYIPRINHTIKKEGKRMLRICFYEI